jgi:hypothetical protein
VVMSGRNNMHCGGNEKPQQEQAYYQEIQASAHRR